MKIKKIYFVFSLVLFLFSAVSCVDEPTYEVESVLDDYLQRFLNEGALRGKTFNLEKQGIILKFGDLDADVAGICYYEDPIRILIDQAYWDKISKSANAEDLRENLVFHELGHGLLDRRHINDYLPNGDWKSIMCGGTEKDNRSWNINFRSIRRSYYLDELFNPSTPTPYWATKVFDGSVTEMPIIEDDFTTSLNWPTGNTTKYSASIESGLYTFENKSTEGTFVVVNIPLQTSSDFYMESSFKIQDESVNTQCGLLFGNAESPVSVNYFSINNNKRMFVGHNHCFGWYTELLKAGLFAQNFNTIGLRKIGQDIYYYINGECVYCDQLSINKQGTIYGFEVAGSCTLVVDYFKVYSNTLRSASLVKTAVVEPITATPKAVWGNK
ncbi:MAG: hypothetical protein JXQ69_05175 [Paludibacteraceae bacterium]|nr:hypothetical protein [Paludibacteraceae bacterium]MBN2787702.1 hypothetical protein [Paludibacteraceae bacterium]